MVNVPLPSRWWVRLAPLVLTLGGPPVSAALLLLAFSDPSFGWLAWVALMPFAAASRAPAPLFEKSLGAFLGGLVLHLIGLDWVRAGFGTYEVQGAKSSVYICLSAVAAASWPLSSNLLDRLGRRMSMAGALPLAWIVGEYARYRGFAVFGGDGFPVLQAGHTQINCLPVAQLASIGGVWAVTGILAVVNGALLDALFHPPRAGMAFSIRGLLRLWPAVTALSVAWTFGIGRLSGANVRLEGPVVALMAVGAPPVRELADASATEGQLIVKGAISLNGLQEPPDVLLWPEDGLRSEIVVRAGPVHDSSSPMVRALGRLAALADASLVIPAIRFDPSTQSRHNSAVWVSRDSKAIDFYDKTCLVPFVEFQPNWTPSLSVGDRTPIGKGTRTPLFRVTRKSCPTPTGKPHRLGTLICYDVLFPDCTRNWMRDGEASGPPDLFVLSSCEVCDPHGRLSKLVQAQARFRAIESGRGFVRNTVSGWCGVIDPLGREIVRASEPTPSASQNIGRTPCSHHDGLYVKLGDWLPLLCVAVTGGVVLARSPILVKK